MDGKSGELRVRRSGRSMNRNGRDRGAEMRLTERTRKLTMLMVAPLANII